MARYLFGRCELDTDRHRLLVAGIERHTEPQVFDLLRYLVEQGDRLVTRDDLIEQVWKGRVVSDSAISVRINAARKVVGDTGSRQDIIKTVPRKGFKLALGVDPVTGPDPPPGQSAPSDRDAAAVVEDDRRPLVGIFPFDCLSEEMPAYLSRGIVDDIATELSRFHSIEVLSTYSTFRHDFSRVDLLDVAKSLGLTHAVTGSLQGSGENQRITVTLVNVESGSRLWSERYEVRADDIFSAQDDAALRIVSALVTGLTEHQTAVARRKPTSNLSAYECLLRGLQIYKWGVTSLEQAKQALFWFDRAIELDPEYARARAWRECCDSLFWSSPPTREEIEASSRRMRYAMSLDESDHEAHRLKGSLHMCAGEHEQGEYHLAKSVELNPNDAHILVKIGFYRSFLAENTDDLTYVDLAFSRNPLHPAWYWHDRGITLFAHGEYEEAITDLLRSDSETETSFLYLAAAHAALGHPDEAAANIDKLHALSPGSKFDGLRVSYPTRCYEDSAAARQFFKLLSEAGL